MVVVVVVTVVGTERAVITSSSSSSSSSIWCSQETGCELGSRFTGKKTIRCTAAETDAFQLKIH